MSISHRTNRLKLVGQPSVEQLQNGRYRLTVNCTALNTRNDWYSANKDRIFPDYGSLQSAEMSIDGLAPREGEAYADMRLTKVESGNRSMRDGGDYLVVLTYETLGSSFVQVKDDNTDYELNGLRRVTRTSIAEAGTDYVETVGTSYIDHQIDSETAVRCFLASYAIDDTDSFRQVQEVYVEAGILSETLDNVGSQKAKVIETIGTDPATPAGYLLASKQESDFEGFQTNRFTFLKPSVLSRNVDTRNNGKLKVETVEAFNETPTSTIGGVQISIRQSDVEGIPTNQYVFASGIGEVERSSETKNQGALTITTVTSLGFPGIATGVQIKATTKEEDGYTLFRNTFANGSGEVSRTVQTKNKGALTITTIESLGNAPSVTGFQIENTSRNQDGYTLFRGVFAQGAGIISVKTDKQYQDTLKIVTTTALGAAQGIDNISSSSREEDGYTIFTNVGATGNGEISNSTEERNQGKVKINRIVSVGSAPVPTGTIIGRSEKKSDGHTVYDYTAALGEGQIFTSTRPGPSQISGTKYVTVRSVGTRVDPPGVITATSETESDGYKTFEVTGLQGSIVGTKMTYKDVVDVEVPGTVSCTTESVTSGTVSGTIAVPLVTPRRRKRVAATVTVEVTTTPSDTAELAYDLGKISCSVTSTNAALARGIGNTVSTGGNAVITRTGYSQDFNASARIQVFPGSYLTSATSIGSINYITSEEWTVSGNIISPDVFYSQRVTKCTGTGSTSANGYSESGIIKRDSRPILTAVDGTTFYEVITWST